MLSLLTEQKPTLGELYPNMKKFLSIAETLIISTSAVERVFSRVKNIVTDKRNKLEVKTTSKLLTVGIKLLESMPQQYSK